MEFIIKYTLILYYLISAVKCELTIEEKEMIDSFMEELIQCRGFPGAALSLVRDGNIELARGYGFANVEDQDPFTADSRFAIASVSKSFTTTLSAKLLATRPLLSWDTVARDGLGEDFHFIDGYRSNNTRLRDLASHQTGLSRNDMVWVLNAFDSREEIVMEKVRFMEEYYPIRTDWLYTNNMLSVLGFVLEREFGASWEELLTNELLLPLGMNSTTFYDFAAPDYEGFVTPYILNVSSDEPLVLVPGPYDMWSGAYLAGPAASVCSNANDLAKWMQFILSGGLTSEGERLVEKEDLDRLWYAEAALNFPHTGRPAEEFTDSMDNLGLGYFNGYYRGYRTFSHGGDLSGFHSEIYFVPDMNIGTFFHTNAGKITGERPYIHRFMVDVLLGLEPVYNATEVCEIFDFRDRMDQSESSMESHDISSRSRDHLNELFSTEAIDMLTDLKLISYVSNIISDPKAMFTLSEAQAMVIHNAKNELIHNLASRAIENYEGRYGDFLYGNLTVVNHNSCAGCLYLEYGKLGKYILEPTNVTDVFIGFGGVGSGSIITAEFIGEDEFGNALSVDIPMFPAVFKRDLMMSEAPEARNDMCVSVY